MPLTPLDPNADPQGLQPLPGILGALKGGSLPNPFAPPDAPPVPMSLPSGGMATLPGGLRPLVTNPRQQQESLLQDKINSYENPAQPQGFWHKLGHIANTIRNVAETALVPGVAAADPTSSLHQAMQHGSNVRELAGLQSEDTQEKDAASKRTLEGAQTGEAEARTNALENPPDKPDQFTFQQTDHGLMRIDNVTGQATPVTYNGQPLKPFEKPPTDKLDPAEQQFTDEYQKLHPGSTIAAAQHAYALNRELPQRPPQITIVNPSGQVQTVHPGDTISPGSTTVSGFNSESINQNKQDETAKKAKDDAQKEYQLAETLVANPSPTNDLALVMRYIGATKPDSLGKLRLNQNEINLVMGTRSTFGDLEALAQKVQSGQMLIPKQREDMLKTMKILTGGGGAAGPQRPANVPEGYVYQDGPKGKGWYKP